MILKLMTFICSHVYINLLREHFHEPYIFTWIRANELKWILNLSGSLAFADEKLKIV